MATASLDILTEPRGDTYRALLHFAARRCTQFSLVWGKKLRFGPQAQQVAVDLQPWLIREDETKSWPGTTGQLALVRHYRVARRSVAVLAAADGLYSWLSPVLPEDLAFYSPGGDPWLGSVAHEGMSWFLDPLLSEQEVVRGVPGIELWPKASRGAA